jgi:hypothetical protein
MRLPSADRVEADSGTGVIESNSTRNEGEFIILSPIRSCSERTGRRLVTIRFLLGRKVPNGWVGPPFRLGEGYVGSRAKRWWLGFGWQDAEGAILLAELEQLNGIQTWSSLAAKANSPERAPEDCS